MPPRRRPWQRVWDACLANTRPRMDLLAQRLDPKATWDDIVLPAEVEQLLRQIAGQVAQRSTVYDAWGFRARMNRGLGISALFAGESGTGKTMAAEVLANELRLNLYRIDLSAVVSKYIGETEKNLRRLFDAAEDGGAILFFDEADALFGKRSEVKDSHDRYANIEVNYLLQRMEAYGGLAILATNMKSALDPAFRAPAALCGELPVPERGGPGAHLAEGVPAADASGGTGLHPAGAAQPGRRQHPQHRAQRRVPGRATGQAGEHAAGAGRGRGRVPQAGAARARGGFCAGRRERVTQ